MPLVRTRPRRPITPVLLVVALALAACGTAPTEPGDAVADAVEQTARDSFAFTLRVETDDAGRALMSEEDPQFAALLRSLEVRGSVDRPGVQFTVEALGFEVFELRRVDAERSYVRLDPDAIALLSEGGFDAATIRRDLEGAPDALRDAGEALLAGDWVGLEGDPRDLGDDVALPFVPWSGMAADEESKEAFRRHVAADVGEFVDRFARVTEAGGDDEAIYDVTLRLRALAIAIVEMLSESGGPLAWMADEEVGEDLEDVPEAVGGLTVRIADRRVERLALDVLEVGRSLGEEVPDGSVSIVVELADHGGAAAIVEPDGATVLDLAELFDLFMGTGHRGHVELGGDVVEAPAEPYEAPEGDLERQARLLDAAQETHAAQHGGFTDDVVELFAYGLVSPAPGVAYGLCLYDDGEAYVVGVAAESDTVYVDFEGQGQVTSDPGELGCVPELSVPDADDR